jgi:mitogen-activated protein kinase 15
MNLDAQRTYREIMFLKKLEGHENIVTLQGLMSAKNNMDIYIITELMESDLHSAIKNDILEEVHKQYIIYQILKALKYMHSAELIHRDLKPQNILLNADCRVKICDFGLARSVAGRGGDGGDDSFIMTDYVATRWYRAPELLLGTTIYRKEIDIWAIACILGEMIIGKPVFPGVSTIDQLEKIMDITGKPSSDDLESINAIHGKSLMDSISNKARPKSTSMSVLIQNFPKGSHASLEFMKSCFQFNPFKRLSVNDLLRSEYIAKFHNPEKETNCLEIVSIPLDDNRRFLVDDYRNALYREVEIYEAAAEGAKSAEVPELAQIDTATVSSTNQQPNVELKQSTTVERDISVDRPKSAISGGIRSSGLSGSRRSIPVKPTMLESIVVSPTNLTTSHTIAFTPNGRSSGSRRGISIGRVSPILTPVTPGKVGTPTTPGKLVTMKSAAVSVGTPHSGKVSLVKSVTPSASVASVAGTIVKSQSVKSIVQVQPPRPTSAASSASSSTLQRPKSSTNLLKRSFIFGNRLQRPITAMFNTRPGSSNSSKLIRSSSSLGFNTANRKSINISIHNHA